MIRKTAKLSVIAAVLLAAGTLHAQEAAIRKALAERIPSMPKIDEVRPSPIAGLYEVRYGGTEIVYTDAKGEFLLQGSMLDTKTMANLTEERIEKLTAVDFHSLPFKDAMVFTQGTGARKMAVFVDPNCGYCKRFERDLSTVKDVTIYTFLYPILGPDSNVKSRDIWCAKDNAKTWRTWMIDGVTPPKSAGCDVAALERNLELGRKYKISGTPAVIFEDGTRFPGALPVDRLEQRMKEAKEANAAAGKKAS